MNFFLTLVILIMCAGGYLMYNQDQQKIAALQQQLDDANSKGKDEATPNAAIPTVAPSAPGTNHLPTPSGVAATVKAPAAPVIRPAGPVTATAVAVPDGSHSSAIDAAANAATTASNSAGVGTFTTLDGHTYSNCKVLKVEQDGVTFSHDDGITKVLYPLMPPNIQKLFDYDPQKAVAQTDAQIRYDQQQAALSNAAPAAPASTNP
jgi:hypothetical protein